MSVVIYHNPDCGTSRNVLSIIRASGYEPTIVEYLITGWTVTQLLGLFAAANLTPRTALRQTKSPAAELGLLSEDVSDIELLNAMVEAGAVEVRPGDDDPDAIALLRRLSGVSRKRWPATAVAAPSLRTP